MVFVEFDAMYFSTLVRCYIMSTLHPTRESDFYSEDGGSIFLQNSASAVNELLFLIQFVMLFCVR
jgi:hypothetical protein